MFGNQSPVQQGGSAVAGGRPMSRGRKVVLAVFGIAAAGAIAWLASPTQDKAKDERRQAPSDRPGEIGARFQPVSLRPPPPPMPPADPPATAAAPPGAPLPMVAPRPYSPAPLLAFGSPAGTAPPPAPQGGAMPPAVTAAYGGAPAQEDRLAASLRATDQDTAVATRLPDRDLFLTMGQPMPCIPEQPITSEVAGIFRCKVPTAVYGTSGNVPLLDPGTWIVGQVREGVRRGTRRLFAVMTRIETPQGCLVRIRAPAADALGQAGLDGEIDSHFWQRFGGYLAVAFIDTAMQAAVLGAVNAIGRSSGGISFFQFQNAGRQGASGAFQDDMNIPPTLYRNQADPIVVVAAQDIDMRPCFRLRPRESNR